MGRGNLNYNRAESHPTRKKYEIIIATRTQTLKEILPITDYTIR